ncbi:hypothetical protein Hanom_Chr05g00437401 [Helianthus anomalus]
MAFDGRFLCSCVDSESVKFVVGLKILHFLHVLGLKIYLFAVTFWVSLMLLFDLCGILWVITEITVRVCDGVVSATVEARKGFLLCVCFRRYLDSQSRLYGLYFMSTCTIEEVSSSSDVNVGSNLEASASRNLDPSLSWKIVETFLAMCMQLVEICWSRLVHYMLV